MQVFKFGLERRSIKENVIEGLKYLEVKKQCVLLHFGCAVVFFVYFSLFCVALFCPENRFSYIYGSYKKANSK